MKKITSDFDVSRNDYYNNGVGVTRQNNYLVN